jgi:GxxExxY protein
MEGGMMIENLTKSIIGAVFKVHNTLGPGFLESVYEKSLLIELRNLGIEAKAQEPVKVYYDSQMVGDFIADVIIERELILELKAVSKLTAAHEVQLVNYLNATGIDDGLLINFGSERAEVKHKYRA